MTESQILLEAIKVTSDHLIYKMDCMIKIMDLYYKDLKEEKRLEVRKVEIGVDNE